MANRTLSSPKVTAQITGTIQNTMDDGQAASGGISSNTSDTLTPGVSANQANRAWQWKNKVLSAAASITIDLFDFAGFDMGAGAGNDIVGQALALEEIVIIQIKNENAVTAAGVLEIIPDASNGWTPIGIHTAALGGALSGGGVLLKYNPAEAGFDVTDASNHRIQLTANGGNITYSVWVLGRHDDNESSSSSSSVSSSSSSLSSSSDSSSSQSSSSSVSSSSDSSSSQSSSSSSSDSSSSSQS